MSGVGKYHVGLASAIVRVRFSVRFSMKTELDSHLLKLSR